jgi:hypothetical protein
MNWFTFKYTQMASYRVYLPIYVIFSISYLCNLNTAFRIPFLNDGQALWVYVAPICLSVLWSLLYLVGITFLCSRAIFFINVFDHCRTWVKSFLMISSSIALILHLAMLQAETWLSGLTFKRLWVLLIYGSTCLLLGLTLAFYKSYLARSKSDLSLKLIPKVNSHSEFKVNTNTKQGSKFLKSSLLVILYSLWVIGIILYLEWNALSALPLLRWGYLCGLLLLVVLAILWGFHQWISDTQCDLTDEPILLDSLKPVKRWFHFIKKPHKHRSILIIIILHSLLIWPLLNTPVSFPTRTILKQVNPISYMWASRFMSAGRALLQKSKQIVASCHPQEVYASPRPLTRTQHQRILQAWANGFTKDWKFHDYDLSQKNKESQRKTKKTKKKRKPPHHVRPDIILISTDALRADFTSLIHIKHRKTTPHLAKYQKQATIFTQAYSPASSTRQTFQALFTGTHPSLVATQNVKRWAMSLNETQPTLAQKITASGYRSIAIVSAQGTFTSNPNALKGFGTIDLSTAKAWKKYHYAANTHVDRIIAHLSNPSDPPAFIWTHLLDTHQKYSVGPQMKRFSTQHGRYRSAIHHVDRALGRLLNFARSPERKRRTIVIFTSDHGQLLGERKFPKHQHGLSTLSAETHVPLVIWGPHIPAQRINTPVSLLDLYPTLLEWVGLSEQDYIESCARTLNSGIFGTKLAEKSFMLEQIPDASKKAFGVSWVNPPYKLNGLPFKKQWWLEQISSKPKSEIKSASKSSAETSAKTSSLVQKPVHDTKQAIKNRLKKELSQYLLRLNHDLSFYDLDDQILD